MSSFVPVAWGNALPLAIVAVLTAGCSKSLDEPWSTMAVPMFHRLEVERSGETSLSLRFDPSEQSENETLEQLASELSARGWVRIDDPVSSKGKPKLRFAKSEKEPELTAYAGHGSLQLDLRKPWPDVAGKLAAARRGGGEKRADIDAFAGRLEAAIGAGATWKVTAGHKCPDDRLREIVAAETAKRPPGYLAGVDPNTNTRAPLSNLLGLRSVPNERAIEANGVDEVWAEAEQVRRGGIVLVFSEASSEDATLEGGDQFRTGSAGARFVVVELASAQPLCGGGLAGFSSKEVLARRGRESEALEADLSRQVAASVDASLTQISAYLRYQ